MSLLSLLLLVLSAEATEPEDAPTAELPGVYTFPLEDADREAQLDSAEKALRLSRSSPYVAGLGGVVFFAGVATMGYGVLDSSSSVYEAGVWTAAGGYLIVTLGAPVLGEIGIIRATRRLGQPLSPVTITALAITGASSFTGFLVGPVAYIPIAIEHQRLTRDILAARQGERVPRYSFSLVPTRDGVALTGTF